MKYIFIVRGEVLWDLMMFDLLMLIFSNQRYKKNKIYNLAFLNNFFYDQNINMMNVLNNARYYDVVKFLRINKYLFKNKGYG